MRKHLTDADFYALVAVVSILTLACTTLIVGYMGMP